MGQVAGRQTRLFGSWLTRSSVHCTQGVKPLFASAANQTLWSPSGLGLNEPSALTGPILLTWGCAGLCCPCERPQAQSYAFIDQYHGKDRTDLDRIVMSWSHRASA